MKLVIAGASGFVGTELVRQSLRWPGITTVIALARSHISVPDDLDPAGDVSRLKTVVVEDYSTYSEDVRKELAEVDGCIWTVAITPRKSIGENWEVIRRVCHDSTLAGLEALYKSRSKKSSQPFRFMYVSGMATERDQSKKPRFMPEYSLMRGETENQVLAFAEKHKDQVEACVSKPGLITAPSRVDEASAAIKNATERGFSLPSINVTDLCLGMIDQVIAGFEKEPLGNDDLIELGKHAREKLGISN